MMGIAIIIMIHNNLLPVLNVCPWLRRILSMLMTANDSHNAININPNTPLNADVKINMVQII
jgi:hypothetical protein